MKRLLGMSALLLVVLGVGVAIRSSYAQGEADGATKVSDAWTQSVLSRPDLLDDDPWDRWVFYVVFIAVPLVLGATAVLLGLGVVRL